jgi:hypothetical protein
LARCGGKDAGLVRAFVTMAVQPFTLIDESTQHYRNECPTEMNFPKRLEMPWVFAPITIALFAAGPRRVLAMNQPEPSSTLEKRRILLLRLRVVSVM